MEEANIFTDDFEKTIAKAQKGDLIFVDSLYAIQKNKMDLSNIMISYLHGMLQKSVEPLLY
ncbi:hypothetical protein [Roseburia hominis]|uniref:hypothetical protein n=1 Tax=Roseburia hominis TaxID=301301 RepID=UPI00236677FC|nr:hypothetical protein [Roseburia hominis]